MLTLEYYKDLLPGVVYPTYRLKQSPNQVAFRRYFGHGQWGSQKKTLEEALNCKTINHSLTFNVLVIENKPAMPNHVNFNKAVDPVPGPVHHVEKLKPIPVPIPAKPQLRFINK